MPRPPDRARSSGAAKTKLPLLKDRLELGTHGLRVSPFCQGMTAGEPDLICAAFDAGINFFFVSSDLHWPLYDTVRVGLDRLLARGGRIRERIVVAATSYVEEPQAAHQSYRELLAAMPRLGHLDVLVAGGLYAPGLVPHLHALEDALASGEFGAKAIGASFHDRRAAATAHAHELVDVVFSRYNPRHPGSELDLFPRLSSASRTLLFNFRSIDGHIDEATWPRLRLSPKHWRPREPDYYRFALSSQHMDGILGSLGTPRELAELKTALREGPLDEEGRTYLVQLARLAGELAPPKPRGAT